MGDGGVQTQTSQAEGKQKLSWDTEVLHLLGLGYFLGRLPGMEQSRQENHGLVSGVTGGITERRVFTCCHHNCYLHSQQVNEQLYPGAHDGSVATRFSLLPYFYKLNTTRDQTENVVSHT